METKFNYNNRVFRSKSNSESGEVDDQTIFHYRQKGNILSASYSGGQVRLGQMLGIVNPSGEIRFNYQHINSDGYIRSGSCISKPEELDSGGLLLYESWQWLDGKKEKGKSIVEEVLD
jgi:hypothetical protein